LPFFSAACLAYQGQIFNGLTQWIILTHEQQSGHRSISTESLFSMKSHRIVIVRDQQPGFAGRPLKNSWVKSRSQPRFGYR